MTHAVETMAYTGEVPWHGLGTEVNNTMSPKEMLKAAQIDWTVSKRPAYTTDRPDVWNLNDPTDISWFVTQTTRSFRLAARVMFPSKMRKLWTSLKSLPRQAP